MRIRSPYEILAETITRHPRLGAGVVVGALVVALLGASLITMETGMDTYVDKNTDRGMLLSKYTDTFQSDSIMVLIEADEVLSPEVLAYVDGLERDFRPQRYVTEVSSITDLLRQTNGGSLPASHAEVQQGLGRLSSDLISRMVPSPSLMFIAVGLEPGLSQDSQFSLLDNMNSVIRVSDRPAGVTVTVTGEPAFGQQMMAEMGTSMSVLLLAAMILMVIAVGLLFGQVRYRLLSVGIVASGVLCTFGFMGLSGIKISMVVIGAFPVLIGIGIDYAIQFHSRFDEEARKTPLPEAVKKTLTRAGPSVLYAMLATAMGFVALWISPVPMIRGFGIVCVIGLFFCYIAALIIVPLVGLLTNYRPMKDTAQHTPVNSKKTVMEHYNDVVGNLAGRVARNPLPVVLICGIIAVIGVQMDSQIIINTDEKTFVPSDMPAKIQLDKVVRTMGPTGSLPIYLRGEGVFTVEGMEWIHKFQKYEETHNSKITGSTSIADLILIYNGGELPTTQQELENVLDRIPEDQKKRYISGTTEAVIEFSMVQMENNVAMASLEEIEKHLTWNEPPTGVTAKITGMGEMFTNLIKEIEAGKTQMTLLAFGLILAFLYFIYRSFAHAVTPVIPIVLIVGWNGLVMYILGIDYTPMTATLGSMTIGVASEYTILIMERAYEERANGLPLLPAIQRSVAQIGTAITVSGMTTVFGFAALMLSAFNMINNFGAVTVITVGFTLIGAIVVMPGVLSLLGRFEEIKANGKSPLSDSIST